jgi:O-antigen/teichoic acid export membrane protein
MNLVRRIAGRAGWSVADQVLSSIINFGLGIAVARVSTPAEFGVYALVFSAYLMAINVTRPLALEPLIIRFTGASGHAWKAAVARAAGMVIVAGLGLGVIAVAIGLIAGAATDSGAGTVFVILGVGLPGLVLQDAWRLTFFAERRGREAFLNDLAWATTTLAIGAAVTANGNATVAAYLAAWVIGANLGALVGVVRVAVRPRIGQVGRWWAEQRDLARPLLGEHVVTNIAGEAIPYLVSAVAGITAAAALRGAQLLLGPFNVVFQAVHLIALPEAVRINERAPRRLVPLAIGFSAVLFAGVMVVGLAMTFMPDALGEALLGSTWEVVRPVMFPFTLYMAGFMAAAGPMVALRGMGEAVETLIVAGARSGLTVVGAAIGAVAGGAPGAAGGMAIGTWVGAVGAWWRFVRCTRRRGSPA